MNCSFWDNFSINPVTFLVFTLSKKVTGLIEKLSQKEQFIIITHNDYTIKQGDRVYGVSMEGGESKILGLELPGSKAG
jgi:chromosome segregation ATPase